MCSILSVGWRVPAVPRTSAAQMVAVQGRTQLERPSAAVGQHPVQVAGMVVAAVGKPAEAAVGKPAAAAAAVLVVVVPGHTRLADDLGSRLAEVVVVALVPVVLRGCTAAAVAVVPTAAGVVPAVAGTAAVARRTFSAASQTPAVPSAPPGPCTPSQHRGWQRC